MDDKEISEMFVEINVEREVPIILNRIVQNGCAYVKVTIENQKFNIALVNTLKVEVKV